MSPETDPPPHTDDAVPERFRVDLSGRTLLGVYEVTGRLADGGMGSIFRAQDTSLDRPVVVKVPHARFLAEPGFRARLAREIAELVRLEHPHVVRILARGEVDDIPFFVLQYLGGGSLEDRLAAGARAKPEDTLPWLSAMARTLDFVHRRGSLHRDVKPANILFDEEGHVFLSDFGVAKALDTQGGDALTGTGVGIGSPKYMAPEQALGHAVGPAVDQYGLASSLYEALAGDVPFHGTPVEILVRKSREDPTPIGDHVPDLPEPAAAALMRAMARDPAARFTSCEAFADAFAVGLEHAPAPPPAPASSGRAPPPADVAAARRKRLAGNVLATVLVAVALVAFFSRGREGSDVEPPASRTALSDVELIDPGEGPRRRLRYAVAPGASETMVMLLEAVKETELPGMDAFRSEAPPCRIEADLSARQGDTEDELAFTVEIRRCTPYEPAEEVAALSTFLEAVEGHVVRGRVDTRGFVRDVRFEPSETSTGTEELLRDLQLVMEGFTVPLPAEPVGTGARWSFAQASEQKGMRMVVTSECELVSIGDEGLAVRVRTALTAPEQGITVPGAPEDLGLTLTSFHGFGTSDFRLDLEHLVPRALATRIEGRYAAQAGTPAPQGSITGAFRNELELYRQR